MDVSALSDEELLAAIGGAQSATAGVAGMSNEALLAAIGDVPRQEIETTTGQKAALGFLEGVAGLGDLGSLIADYAPMPSASSGLVARLRGIPREESAGDRFRGLVDAVAGVKDATKIGGDTFAYKAAQMVPGFAMPLGGATSLASKGVVGAGKELAEILGTSALSAGGGMIGKAEGGTAGEIAGQILTPMAATAAAKGITSLGRALGPLAEATENKVYGFGATDIRKSLEKGVRQAGDEAPIKAAIDRLIAEKAIVPGEAAASRQALELQVQEIGNKLGSTLQAFDNVQPTPIQISYDNAKKYIASQVASTKQKQALDILDDIATNTNNNNVLVSEWTREQRNLANLGKSTYGQSGSDALEATINKYAALDIKQALDKELADPVFTSSLGKDAVSYVQGLRKQLSDRHAAIPALIASEARQSSQSIPDALISRIRTSGGYGVPTIAGAVLGGPLGALAGLGAGAALSSTRGQLATAGAAKAAAPSLESLGGSLQGRSASDLAKAIAILQAGQAAEPTGPIGPTEEDFALQLDEELPSYQPTISQADPVESILDAIKQVESNGNPNAVSPKGAEGAYQIMPEMQKRLGVSDPTDEADARAGAKKLFLDELSFFGDPKLAMAAYNLGRPKMLKLGKWKRGKTFEDIAMNLPKETREYVPKVLAQLEKSGGLA
jgi:soluble lytic murein transglycosylase-like protein